MTGASLSRTSVAITVSNEELVTVRDAMRGLHTMVARLERGEVDKFVLMHRGRMIAAVVPLAAAVPHEERNDG